MASDARLVEAPIDAAAELAAFLETCQGAGAVVSFCGIARPANAAGDPVDRLRLEAHPRLTALSLERIAGEGMRRFDISDALVIHRHGSIAPGEVIVFVAAASRHRRQAFLAADFLMDRLKTEAVFWKKEEGAEGGRWIEPTEADRAAASSWDA